MPVFDYLLGKIRSGVTDNPLIANIIPRTGALATLLGLTNSTNPGELGVALDGSNNPVAIVGIGATGAKYNYFNMVSPGVDAATNSLCILPEYGNNTYGVASVGISSGRARAGGIAVGELANARGSSSFATAKGQAVGDEAVSFGSASVSAADQTLSVGNASKSSVDSGIALGYKCTVGWGTRTVVSVSGNDFVVSGDQTLKYGVGKPIRGLRLADNKATDLMTISAVSYSPPNTTITVSAWAGGDLTQAEVTEIVSPIAATGGVALGTNARSLQPAQIALSAGIQRLYALDSLGGTNQRTLTTLSGRTTSTTPTQLTSNGSAASGTVIGVANKFITESNKSYAITATVHGKLSASGLAVSFDRKFIVTNNAGTVTISAVSTIGTDITDPGVSTVAPTFTISGTELVVTVQAAVATSIAWRCDLWASEIRDAA